MKTFVLQKNERYDYTDLENWGHIIELYPPDEDIKFFDTEMLLEQISERLAEQLYEPETDNICLTGHMTGVTLLCFAAGMFAHRYHQSLHVLLFEAKRNKYFRKRLFNNEHPCVDSFS